MPKIWDYDCTCGVRFEALTMSNDEVVECPECKSTDVHRVEAGGVPFNTIVPMHRTSLRSKAGYVHTHGDRPAEKGSVAVPGNKGAF